MGNLARAYEGGAKSRGTGGWTATSASADAIIGSDLSTLRDRSRDLVRNNAFAAKAVQVLVNSAVGYGIRPRPNTSNKRVERKLIDLWERWSAVCDADGHTNFDGLLGLAVREMFEGGEALLIRRWRRAGDGLPLPFQIEVREGEHFDDGIGAYGRERVSQGIEYDATGRRVAYWLHQDHPGDSRIWSRRTSQRIPATEVAHLFERQRTQNRGVPWGAPAMRAIRDLDDWHLAEQTRKKTEACLVGVIIGDEQDTSRPPAMVDEAGRAVEGFTPGMIAYASGTKDVKFNQPSSTGGVYEWHSVQAHQIAAGFRVPYELMTGDLKQVNFSSSRVGMNEFRRMIELLQWQTIIPMACDKVWAWFCEAAYLEGHIPTPYVPSKWDPPRFDSVNPLQDAQADLLEVRAGFASLPQMISKRGYSPDEVAEEQAAYLTKTGAMGLIHDSDPARVSKAGQVQQDQSAPRDEGDSDAND